jgi:uncharacterized integral membrane protein
VSNLNDPDEAPDVASDPAPTKQSSQDHRRHGVEEREHFRHTRTSAAWAAITVAVLFGVALIVFIAQNTRDVRLEFFSANGRIPVSVALLAAALAGAVVVLAIGVGRVAQLRFTMRRQRRQRQMSGESASGDNSPDEGSSGRSS